MVYLQVVDVDKVLAQVAVRVQPLAYCRHDIGACDRYRVKLGRMLSSSHSAINAARSHIVSSYGEKYLPAKPKYYKTKAKNAQEAHEAIRPTDPARRPSDVAHVLNPDELKLYELIWRRMVASQMEHAIQERTTITIHNPDKSAELRVTGSILTFDGFMKLYQEGRDDQEEEGDRLLPPVAIGTELSIASVKEGYGDNSRWKWSFVEIEGRFGTISKNFGPNNTLLYAAPKVK